MQREAHSGGSPTGVAVQHRNDDGHICAANRDDEQKADEEGKRGNGPENPRALVNGEITDKTKDRCQSTKVYNVPQRQEDRRTRHFAREFQECDDRPRKCDGTNGDTQAHFNTANRVYLAIFTCYTKGSGVKKRGSGNKDRGHANKRVERGHELRHIGHGDFACRNPANAATDSDGTENFWQRCDFVRYQGCDNGDKHAGHAETVTALRRCRRR